MYVSVFEQSKIISPLCIKHKKKTFYQSMVFWNMRCWLTRACRRMGWTWLENLSSGRPEGQGAALSLVVRYYYLACTYIRSPILRSCCRQARLSYTPPINRWLAQSKNWLSSNLSINFKVKMGRWAVKGMSSHKWSGVRSHRSQHKSFLAAAAATLLFYQIEP